MKDSGEDMDKVEVLRSVNFGQRVAEEESEVLASYFVETDHWQRVFTGAVDVVYGPKGSGKSAIYTLLVARTDELFDRKIILAPAENPRGTPVFRDLVLDPPLSEREFTGLWKLYFVSLLHGIFDEYGIGGVEVKQLENILAREGLIRGRLSLQSVLKAVWGYARRMLRPTSAEGSVAISTPGQPSIVYTGKITFSEPSADEASAGLISVDQLLGMANNILRASPGFVVWILLDRLDVAFAEDMELEQNALRALFRVYLDMLNYSNMRLKIFLRTDIWNRLSAGGFREASHITRHMTIDWNRTSLVNLVVRRAIHNAVLQQYYGVTHAQVLDSTESQEKFFYQMFFEQVDVGQKQPHTFDWVLGRTRDATGRNAPRELIHLLNCTRDVQMRRLEVGQRDFDQEDKRLFARSALKDALPEVSRVRLEQTLYAEYPTLRERLEQLRGGKTQQSLSSLAAVWRIPREEVEKLAHELVEVGFFEQRGTHDNPQYKVPFLYRDSLKLVQGSAD
jgi:hypothetical protein